MVVSPNIESAAPESSSHLTQNVQISIQEATDLCKDALQKAGYSNDQAATITDHLVDARFRGHPFAGLARALSIIEHLKNTEIQANKEIRVTRSGAAYAHLDGHNSVGYLVARQETQIAIEKAKSAGVSVVGANGLWYTGNFAYYAEMATREDLVIFIALNGCRIVAPHGGCEPKFCTNPFCIGFPTSNRGKPAIWDIGTSNIMYAQVKLAERLGVDLREGAAYDSEGRPTKNPFDVFQGALTAWGDIKVLALLLWSSS